ncbi:MAG: hypothetical protein Q4P28_02950 [Tissierellia bacterium]|nr:hypothetical protein [Tissierellia bacterium]
MEAITYTGKEKNLVVYQDSDEQIETTSRPDFLQATFAMGSVEDGICMKKYKHVDANLMIPIANVKEGEEFTFEYKTDVKKGRCAFAILSPDGHLIDKKDPVKNEKGKIIFQAPGEYHIHFVAEDMEGSFIYTDPEE